MKRGKVKTKRVILTIDPEDLERARKFCNTWKISLAYFFGFAVELLTPLKKKALQEFIAKRLQLGAGAIKREKEK